MSPGIINKAKAQGQVRLLIVEPERPYLAMLARRMSELGYRVASADSSRAAIAEFYRSPPDCILTELKGRNFSCAELVTIVRRDAVHSAIPIVVLAGQADHEAAARIIRAGADAFVRKPFHFEVLAARIERELEKKHALDHLREVNRQLDARIAQRAIVIGELKDQIAQLSAAPTQLNRD